MKYTRFCCSNHAGQAFAVTKHWDPIAIRSARSFRTSGLKTSKTRTAIRPSKNSTKTTLVLISMPNPQLKSLRFSSFLSPLSFSQIWPAIRSEMMEETPIGGTTLDFLSMLSNLFPVLYCSPSFHEDLKQLFHRSFLDSSIPKKMTFLYNYMRSILSGESSDCTLIGFALLVGASWTSLRYSGRMFRLTFDGKHGFFLGRKVKVEMSLDVYDQLSKAISNQDLFIVKDRSISNVSCVTLPQVNSACSYMDFFSQLMSGISTSDLVFKLGSSFFTLQLTLPPVPVDLDSQPSEFTVHSLVLKEVKVTYDDTNERLLAAVTDRRVIVFADGYVSSSGPSFCDHFPNPQMPVISPVHPTHHYICVGFNEIKAVLEDTCPGCDINISFPTVLPSRVKGKVFGRSDVLLLLSRHRLERCDSSFSDSTSQRKCGQGKSLSFRRKIDPTPADILLYTKARGSKTRSFCSDGLFQSPRLSKSNPHIYGVMNNSSTFVRSPCITPVAMAVVAKADSDLNRSVLKMQSLQVDIDSKISQSLSLDLTIAKQKKQLSALKSLSKDELSSLSDGGFPNLSVSFSDGDVVYSGSKCSQCFEMAQVIRLLKDKASDSWFCDDCSSDCPMNADYTTSSVGMCRHHQAHANQRLHKDIDKMKKIVASLTADVKRLTRLPSSSSSTQTSLPSFVSVGVQSSLGDCSSSRFWASKDDFSDSDAPVRKEAKKKKKTKNKSSTNPSDYKVVTADEPLDFNFLI